MSEERIHKEDEQLEESFRESLREFRIDPSPHLWNRIRHSLLKKELLRFNFSNVPEIFKVGLPVLILIIGAVITYMAVETD